MDASAGIHEGLTLFPVQRLGRVVSALGVCLWSYLPDDVRGADRREDGDVIDTGKRGEDLRPIAFGVNRPALTLELADGFVAIYGHQKRIAQCSSRLQVAGVTDMQEIEAAVRKHERTTSLSHLFRDTGCLRQCNELGA